MRLRVAKSAFSLTIMAAFCIILLPLRKESKYENFERFQTPLNSSSFEADFVKGPPVVNLSASSEKSFVRNYPEGRRETSERPKLLVKTDFQLGSRRECPKVNSLSQCEHCALNAVCFDVNKTLWHPSKCENIQRFSKSWLRSMPEFSILFVGDSRLRMVFAATLRNIYDSDVL